MQSPNPTSEGNPNLRIRDFCIDLPTFDGDKNSNPRTWIRKFESYFRLCEILDPEERINIAALHLRGKAETWFMGWEKLEKYPLVWDNFVEDIRRRFGVNEMDEIDVMGKFKELRQGDFAVPVYRERFEGLRSLMVMNFSGLSEKFFVASFISGLNDEIKYNVMVFRPQTVERAFEVARLQEMAVEAMLRKMKKFPGLNGNEAGVMAIEEEGDADEGVGMIEEDEDEEEIPGNGGTIGSLSDNRFKIKGLVGEKPIVIMIVTGSSHSFLAERVAEELQCMRTATCPLAFRVADGSRMVSRGKCCDFEWSMQGHTFKADLRLLELGGGFDVILGVDWLSTYSPLRFDFQTKRMFFQKDGKPVELMGTL